MGWGNPTPLVDLKRATRDVRRITLERDDARAALDRVLALCTEQDAATARVSGGRPVWTERVRAAVAQSDVMSGEELASMTARAGPVVDSDSMGEPHVECPSCGASIRARIVGPTTGPEARARHTHRRDTPPRRQALPPRRQAAHLDGGPLHGCTVHIDYGATTVRAPGHAGRYVHTDTDQWTWEQDHRENTVP